MINIDKLKDTLKWREKMDIGDSHFEAINELPQYIIENLSRLAFYAKQYLSCVQAKNVGIVERKIK